MQLVLDFSANTHQNKERVYRQAIAKLKQVDNKKCQVVIKDQLFLKAGNNKRTDPFFLRDMMVMTWENHQYMTTASVFDFASLEKLLSFALPYKLPFVKIANNRQLDHLIPAIPRGMWVYRSLSGDEFTNQQPYNTLDLLCVSKYPAEIRDYQFAMKSMPFHPKMIAISDHTVGLKMFSMLGKTAVVWEKHYKLADSTGLDAGPWAVTPEELSWIL